MKPAILSYEPPYKRPDRIPIFPLAKHIYHSIPYFMYMYLCYYMDENNTIPYPIWEKLYQQYMKQYEKSDWNTKEERRKLKALGLIDYGNGIDTKIFVGRGLYADRSVAETLLKYRNYRDSIFCLYEILLKEENEEIKIKDFMYDYGFAVSTCKYTSAAMKNLY